MDEHREEREELAAVTVNHYVCDRCGNYWDAYRSTECPVCHSTAIWEFRREQPAREHAARIFANRAGIDAPAQGWKP